MHGRTTSTHGITTPHTASEVHGTGVATMILGTAMHGIGADGTGHITMADGTTHTTMADGMIHGITEDGTTHGTTEDITADIMEDITDGTLIGEDTTITIIHQFQSITRTVGTETAGKQAPIECSQAGFQQEEA